MGKLVSIGRVLVAMVSTSTACMGLAAAIGVGTLYVLLHEKKRKRKKLEQHLKDQPLSEEQTMQLFQQNFEHSLNQLIGAIRNSFNVTEKAMDTSFKQHQSDPDVQQAI